MVLAARGIPSLWLVFWTLVGGTMAAGAANAINCYFDRDIDELMNRTKRRPLPAHTVPPENAFVFGLILGVISFALMAFFVNLVAAFLHAGGDGLLRRHLHADPEALDTAEHRAWWRGRGAAAGNWLGGR
jgi:heme O synthase-like polyprenyltransferase